MTKEEIFTERRQTLCHERHIVTVAKIGDKYVNGEEYYLHMAKLAKELAMSDYTTDGGS